MAQNTEADRMRAKKQVQERTTVTDRSTVDKNAVEARRASKQVDSNSMVKPDRGVHVTREQQKKAEAASSSKGSTVERDIRTKQLQNERRAQKASYLNAKTEKEKSTKQREADRMNAKRTNAKQSDK